MLDEFALGHCVGVDECAIFGSNVQHDSIFGEGKACDRLLSIVSVNKVLFDLALLEQCKLLADDHDVNLASLFVVLESHDEMLLLWVGKCRNLSLRHWSFDLSDWILSDDIFLGEATFEVEDFDALSEDDNDPFVKDAQVDDLHVRTELD